MNKKCKVVMLHTNEISNIFVCADSKNIYYKSIANRRSIYNHLYILSNEEIKEGDYFLVNGNQILKKVKFNESVKHEDYLEAENGLPYLLKYCEKIIASTNKLLELPELEDNFIKEYCEKNGVEYVMVEYEIYDDPNFILDLNREMRLTPNILFKLKISPENKITITNDN